MGEFLNLKFHQKILSSECIAHITSGIRRVVLGAKPRSGKTYIIGGIVARMKRKNVLIVTPVPRETIDQFVDGLFLKYADFDRFNVVSPSTIHDFNNIRLNTKDNIVVISKQILQYTNNQSVKFDVVFIDESHFAAITDLAVNMIERYITTDAVVIYVTATFIKPVEVMGVKCIVNWDMEDEMLCRRGRLDILEKKHGGIVNKLEFNAKQYRSMPTMMILTEEVSMEDPRRRMKTIVAHLGDTIIRRIKRISAHYGSRTFIKHRSTQIWFLPSRNIGETTDEVMKIVSNIAAFRRFHFIAINSNENIDNVKDEIRKQEDYVNRTKREGLVILVGNMLQLGITLHNCDVVVILSQTQSYDRLTQQISRCMTEADDKKFGFVVDFDVNRVIESILTYNSFMHMNSNEDKLTYVLNSGMIGIDVDKKDNVTKIISAYLKDRKHNRLIRVFDKQRLTTLLIYIRSISHDDDEVTYVLNNLDELTLCYINRVVKRSIDMNIDRKSVIAKIYSLL